MRGLILCLIAFVLAFAAGRRSLAAGLSVMLAVGYAYGIVRANVVEPFTHFLFDSAVIGLYASQFLSGASRRGTGPALFKGWLIMLAGWPILLSLIPIQDPVVQLVGLRAAIFFLPFVVFGARLTDDDYFQIALWLAVLNVCAFGFAAAEFVGGIEPFFPRSAVTEIMYRSKDVAGMTAWRIPATFSSAHAYGGMMVLTLPLLLGVWWTSGRRISHRLLLASGCAVAVFGVFMSAARLPVVILFAIVTVAMFSLKVRAGSRLASLVLIGIVGLTVSRDERLQRFTTLDDTEAVASRVQSSVNQNFIELVRTHPLGNGLGGGGTSIPFFLQDRLRDPIGMENEYARLAAEQGIPGLAMWIAFVMWILARRGVRHGDTLFHARRLALVATVATFASGLIGTGLLTAIPQTPLTLLYLGWIAIPMRDHFAVQRRHERFGMPQPLPMGRSV